MSETPLDLWLQHPVPTGGLTSRYRRNDIGSPFSRRLDTGGIITLLDAFAGAIGGNEILGLCNIVPGRIDVGEVIVKGHAASKPT